jgi:hypothetical protein
MDDIVCSEVHTFNAGVAEEGEAAGLRIATFRFSLPHTLPLSLASEVWCILPYAGLFLSCVCRYRTSNSALVLSPAYLSLSYRYVSYS